MRGHHDVGGVAPDPLAVPAEHLTLRREDLHRAAGEVPVLRVPRHRPQRPALSSAADADRRVGQLQGLRIAPGILQPDIAAAQGGGLVRQQPDDGLAPFLERVEALTQGGVEIDPVRGRLLFVPSGADAQLEPAARDDVEGRGHLRQHRRMPVGHAGHEHPHAQPLRSLCERGRGDPALETRPGRV